MTDDLIERLRVCAKYDPDQQEAINALEEKDKRIKRLEAELACSIVSSNDAHEQSLEYVYELNDAAKRIEELEKEIVHLEKNFTEWLKEYRAQTDRIAALEAENKKMRLMQDEMLLMTIPVRAALEKK